ncbi:MAG: hypothetical protein LAT64_11470 [Phycisphaerales bacterium]|nr:hypothetical protein [Planctomycetota bacterium]MCH8509371.1 hypothetical protein [Phycisphaerales bacterium]
MLVSSLIVSCSLLVAPAGLSAAPADAPSIMVMDERVSGAVGTVDWENQTFTVRTGGERSQSVTWNSETAFTIDGERSTARAVLMANAKVEVKMDEDGVAASVERRSE